MEKPAVNSKATRVAKATSASILGVWVNPDTRFHKNDSNLDDQGQRRRMDVISARIITGGRLMQLNC